MDVLCIFKIKLKVNNMHMEGYLLIVSYNIIWHHHMILLVLKKIKQVKNLPDLLRVALKIFYD